MSPRRTSAPRHHAPLTALGRRLRRKPAGLTAAAAAAVAVAGAAVAGTAVAGTAVAGTAGPASATAAFPAAVGKEISLPATAAVVRSPVLGPPFAVTAAPDRPAAAGQRSAVRLVAAQRAAEPATPGTPHRAAAHSRPQNVPGHVAPHNPCGTSQLHRWICSAESIMVQHGTPRSAVDTGAAFIVVLHESGGNPRAANGWDANAAAGTPSQGIAQTIAPTFSAFAVPGHRDIWNPVDNMVAAFRYAISRYGSMGNIPGVVAVRQGGSYVGY